MIRLMAIVLAFSGGAALAQVGQIPGWPPIQPSGAVVAPSCTSKITTSSGSGTAILNGTTTAIGKLTCS